MSGEEGFLEDRLTCVALLWSANIKAEIFYKKHSKLLSQIQFCEKEMIPIGVIVGTDEKRNNGVKIRDITGREDKFVSQEDLIPSLKTLLSNKKCS